LVYDQKGRFVGTVKDIGFVPRKDGVEAVGLVVITREHAEREVLWSDVAYVEDIILLGKDIASLGFEELPRQQGAFQALEKVGEATRQPTAEEPARDQAKTCAKCGAENDPKYKYCHRCGARLSPA